MPESNIYTTAEINRALAEAPFQVARSMPNISFSYTLLSKWKPEHRALWFAVVTHMHNNYTEERFGRRLFKYYYANGYKYWTMQPEIENTYLINRAATSQTAYEYIK